MKRYIQTLKASLAALLVTAAFAAAPSAYAQGIFQPCDREPDLEICKSSKTDTATQTQSMTGIVINIMLFIVGAAAVIMIIIGGIRYITSNGDSSSLQSAKNTILYSVVGLIVALLAFGIVNFVVSRFI